MEKEPSRPEVPRGLNEIITSFAIDSEIQKHENLKSPSGRKQLNTEFLFQVRRLAYDVIITEKIIGDREVVSAIMRKWYDQPWNQEPRSQDDESYNFSQEINLDFLKFYRTEMADTVENNNWHLLIDQQRQLQLDYLGWLYGNTTNDIGPEVEAAMSAVAGTLVSVDDPLSNIINNEYAKKASSSHQGIARYSPRKRTIYINPFSAKHSYESDPQAADLDLSMTVGRLFEHVATHPGEDLQIQAESSLE